MDDVDELAVIDREALERLKEWGGEDLVLKMLHLFLEHAPERMEQIRSGASDGALETAERGAHSLKSSAGNLGARRLQSLAAGLEDLAADGDGAGVRAMLPDLESAYDRTRRALSEVADTLSAAE